jgi:chromosome segregation ATPase
MTLSPDDIEKIREIIESRSARTDDVILKLEERIFDEIEKVARQVSKLSDGQQAVNDRTTRLESLIDILMESRTSAGKRLGDLETTIAELRGKESGEAGAKGKAGEWVRWIIPIVISVGGSVLVILTTINALARDALK